MLSELGRYLFRPTIYSSHMKSAVVLAGGKSTRMGIDKCVLLFHGKPLIY
ncbi:MAG: NTP transferase domain-containing protein, partial [Thermoplasmata archaeon]